MSDVESLDLLLEMGVKRQFYLTSYWYLFMDKYSVILSMNRSEFLLILIAADAMTIKTRGRSQPLENAVD